MAREWIDERHVEVKESLPQDRINRQNNERRADLAVAARRRIIHRDARQYDPNRWFDPRAKPEALRDNVCHETERYTNRGYVDLPRSAIVAMARKP